MRILVLHSRYASGASSGENRVVEDEVELLRGAGHDVQLWAPMPDDATPGSRVGLALSAVWSRAAVAQVRRLAAEFRPDVIHVHNLFPMLSPAVLRSTRAPVVVTLHNYRLLCLPAVFLRDGRACEDCLGKFPWRGVVHRCYRDSAAGSAALAASLGVHRRAGTFAHVAMFLAVSEFVCRQARRGRLRSGPDPGQAQLRRRAATAAGAGRGLPVSRPAVRGEGPRPPGVDLARRAGPPRGGRGRARASPARGAGARHRRVPRLRAARPGARISFAGAGAGAALDLLRGRPADGGRGLCRGRSRGGQPLRRAAGRGLRRRHGLLVEPGDAAGGAPPWRACMDDDTSAEAGGGGICRLAHRLQSRAGIADLEAAYEAVTANPRSRRSLQSDERLEGTGGRRA